MRRSLVPTGRGGSIVQSAAVSSTGVSLTCPIATSSFSSSGHSVTAVTSSSTSKRQFTSGATLAKRNAAAPPPGGSWGGGANDGNDWNNSNGGGTSWGEDGSNNYNSYSAEAAAAAPGQQYATDGNNHQQWDEGSNGSGGGGVEDPNAAGAKWDGNDTQGWGDGSDVPPAPPQQQHQQGGDQYASQVPSSSTGGAEGGDEWEEQEGASDFFDPSLTADEVFKGELGGEEGASSSSPTGGKVSKGPSRVKVVSGEDGPTTPTGVRAPAPKEPHPQSMPNDGVFDSTISERPRPTGDSGDAPPVDVDPLILSDQQAKIHEEQDMVEVSDSVIHPYYAALPMEELVECVAAYLNATDNPKLVDNEEEAAIFPALLSRIDDATIPQLLDVIEAPWRRSTMDRYGTVFKDLVRDRVLQEAEDLPPDLLHRSIIVIGISAGRRKRDLDFFKTLGKLLVSNINHYKDPNDLVRVMTAMNRAKIVPPNSFLALMGRRFPVLNKRIQLRSLPAYRVFSNLYRMGYDQMNPFRFLADRMYDVIFENLKKEKIRLKKLERATKSGDSSKVEAIRQEIEQEKRDDLKKLASATKEVEMYDVAALEKEEEEEAWGGTEQGSAAVRRRFIELSEVRPLHFTKLLLVLARLGAPHQQYLRPLIDPLIVPSIPFFPPPSLTRIIRAFRMFKSTDVRLLEAVMDHLIKQGKDKIVMLDVLELLRIIGHPDTPVPKNTEPFMHLCYEIFTDQSRLRARDMCLVTSDLNLFAKKDDVTIPALDLMMQLVDVFCDRMVYLMDLGVLSLTHAEIMEDICRTLKHESEALERLKARRREVNKEGDEEYYNLLDIDVRETFYKMQFVDNFNTYGPFRPIPGLLQVDFKQALSTIRVDNILEAVHLYEQAYPKQLRITLKRLLSKVILMKFSKEGEEIIAEGEYVMKPNPRIYATQELVTTMAKVLIKCPLKRVKRNPAPWEFLLEKSTIIGDKKVMELCNKMLTYLEQAKKAGATQAALEKETDHDHDGESVTEFEEPEEFRTA